jgi:hypothetical protein
MDLLAERLSLEDDPVAISEEYYERGWTDGLPIVPPTPERVERMLAAWNAAPEASIGPLQPAFAEATLEKIAINAVMAGCRPEHLPAVVGALQCMTVPAFNLNAVQCTTSSTTPLILLNGPIRGELDVNCASNALGPGRRSNAVIGRAVRLVMLNIGGASPGDVDKASLGQPGKYTFCLGENEEASPWEPFSVEQGLAPGESAVSVFGVTGSIEVRDSSSQTGEGVMKTMAHSMTSAAFVTASNGGDGGQALVILTPEHAQLIAAGGYSKADAKAWIWNEARMTLDQFSPECAANVEEWQRASGHWEDGVVRVTARPEDIWILVAGGAGSKSVFVPMWGGSTRAITRPVPSLAALV